MTDITPRPFTLHRGDCLEVMQSLPANSADAVVSDPPYELGFMGKGWDSSGVAFQVATWREVLRVAKPGAHLVAFGGTRTFHRLTCAIEDAGWEIRDCLSYLYGSGFPKSLNLDRLDDFCDCEQKTKREVRSVRCADVSASLPTRETAGQVLLETVPEWVAPTSRSTSEVEEIRGGESSVEGRRHLEASEGQLLGGSICTGASMGAADGAEGRIHHGAPLSDGFSRGAIADANRSGASSEPPAIRQHARELGALANESSAQVGGAWPICSWCGKPRVARGLGTALKPSWEPIILARKPLEGTVAANVAKWGSGALNIDGCRIEGEEVRTSRNVALGSSGSGIYSAADTPAKFISHPAGRWPANLVLDEAAGRMLDEQSGERPGMATQCDLQHTPSAYFGAHKNPGVREGYDDSGGASRFFYCAKASRAEREAGLEGMVERAAGSMNRGEASGRAGTNEANTMGADDVRARNHHPTVKPIDLMRWLCRLVTPPNGRILDPFMGSGTTGCAAVLEGFTFDGIDREPDYLAIAEKRIAYWAQVAKLPPTMQDAMKPKRTEPDEHPDLFGAL